MFSLTHLFGAITLAGVAAATPAMCQGSITTQNLPNYIRACSSGDGVTCNILAQFLANEAEIRAMGLRYDLKIALNIAESGCDLGQPQSCLLAGRILGGALTSPEVTPNRQEANSYLTRACDAGLEDACTVLANGS